MEAYRVESIMTGILLGDGGVYTCTPTCNAYYRQVCKHKEYLMYLFEQLKDTIPFKEEPYLYRPSHDTWTITSRVSTYLTELRNLWYPKGIKEVPTDSILDVESLRHWYIGDGCLASRHGCLARIEMASHSFSYTQRQQLAEKLHKLGFAATAYKSGVIGILKRSVKDFLNYISPCPVQSYMYKWNVERLSYANPYYFPINIRQKERVLTRNERYPFLEN